MFVKYRAMVCVQNRTEQDKTEGFQGGDKMKGEALFSNVQNAVRWILDMI